VEHLDDEALPVINSANLGDRSKRPTTQGPHDLVAVHLEAPKRATLKQSLSAMAWRSSAPPCPANAGGSGLLTNPNEQLQSSDRPMQPSLDHRAPRSPPATPAHPSATRAPVWHSLERCAEPLRAIAALQQLARKALENLTSPTTIRHLAAPSGATGAVHRMSSVDGYDELVRHSVGASSEGGEPAGVADGHLEKPRPIVAPPALPPPLVVTEGLEPNQTPLSVGLASSPPIQRAGQPFKPSRVIVPSSLSEEQQEADGMTDDDYDAQYELGVIGGGRFSDRHSRSLSDAVGLRRQTRHSKAKPWRLDAGAVNRFGFIVAREEEVRSSMAEEVAAAGPTPVSREDARRENARIDKWRHMLSKWGYFVRNRYGLVQSRVHKGVPDALRGVVWPVLSGGDVLARRHPSRYRRLLLVAPREDDVAVMNRDLNRTFPRHIQFRDVGGEGQLSLLRVLRAYAVYDKDVGYCQGMAFLAALLLTYMPEESAFWTLVALLRRRGLRSVFLPHLGMYMEQVFVVERLLEHYEPALWAHFKKQGVLVTMFATQWILTLFSHSFPFDVVCRVMDAFCFDGSIVVIRAVVGLLHMLKPSLMTMPFETILTTLRMVSSTVDADTFVAAAFGTRFSVEEVVRHRHAYRSSDKGRATRRRCGQGILSRRRLAEAASQEATTAARESGMFDIAEAWEEAGTSWDEDVGGDDPDSVFWSASADVVEAAEEAASIRGMDGISLAGVPLPSVSERALSTRESEKVGFAGPCALPPPSPPLQPPWVPSDGAPSERADEDGDDAASLASEGSSDRLDWTASSHTHSGPIKPARMVSLSAHVSHNSRVLPLSPASSIISFFGRAKGDLGSSAVSQTTSLQVSRGGSKHPGGSHRTESVFFSPPRLSVPISSPSLAMILGRSRTERAAAALRPPAPEGGASDRRRSAPPARVSSIKREDIVPPPMLPPWEEWDRSVDPVVSPDEDDDCAPLLRNLPLALNLSACGDKEAAIWQRWGTGPGTDHFCACPPASNQTDAVSAKQGEEMSRGEERVHARMRHVFSAPATPPRDDAKSESDTPESSQVACSDEDNGFERITGSSCSEGASEQQQLAIAPESIRTDVSGFTGTSTATQLNSLRSVPRGISESGGESLFGSGRSRTSLSLSGATAELATPGDRQHRARVADGRTQGSTSSSLQSNPPLAFRKGTPLMSSFLAETSNGFHIPIVESEADQERGPSWAAVEAAAEAAVSSSGIALAMGRLEDGSSKLFDTELEDELPGSRKGDSAAASSSNSSDGPFSLHALPYFALQEEVGRMGKPRSSSESHAGLTTSSLRADSRASDTPMALPLPLPLREVWESLEHSNEK
jgi:TBC1 domain family member 10